MVVLTQNQQDMILNATCLSTAKNYANRFGADFVFLSDSDDIKTYKLTTSHSCEELQYCSRCNRTLVDTSYCDGCDQDEEDDFNSGEWF